MNTPKPRDLKVNVHKLMRQQASAIIANQQTGALDDVTDKVYTRDVFGNT